MIEGRGARSDMLRIRLLGPMRLTWSGQNLARPSRTDVRQLLAYLAIARGAARPRSAIAGVLWPESADSVALARLRRTLHRLLQALPDDADWPPWVVRDRSTLRWNTKAPYWLDLDEFDRLDRRSSTMAAAKDPRRLCDYLNRAVGLVDGSLLFGDDGDWLMPERDRYNARHLRLLEQLLEVREAMDDVPAAIATAETLISLDPLHEPANRHHMALLCRQGNPDGAERAYQQYKAALRAELASDPRPETSELYEAICAGCLSAGDELRALDALDTQERALLVGLATLCDCFSLEDALTSVPSNATEAEVRSLLMVLIDRGLVIVCCGSGHQVHYRVTAAVRKSLEPTS